MPNRINHLLGAIIALTFSTCAYPAVLKFEDLPHEDELQGVGDVILSKGFVLNYAPAPGEPYPVGFMSVGRSWPYNRRSTAVAANSCSATTTLTAEDNNPITLESIDVAELNGDSDASVVFEGVTTEGSVVRKSVTLKDGPRWQTVKFPKSFHNLQYVRWTQGDCIVNKPHMFDNIDVMPTWKVKPRR